MRRTHLVTAAAMLTAPFAATPARADPISVSKSVTLASDPLGNLIARSLPGSVAEYRTVATNPIANLFKPVRNIQLVEPLPDTVVLRVADLAGPGKGPVEFADGSLLGTGLLSSGLTYSYSAAAPTTDGLEFWNGTTWAYQPVADAEGYDRNVRAIRITLGSTFATGSTFQLRYRVKIR